MYDIKKLSNELETGKWDSRLQDIYVDENMLTYQRNRYLKALQEYERFFEAGEIELYSAPGRSEVGGNHTDHQNGEVLAAAVNMDALAVVGKRNDNRICLQSYGYPMIELNIEDLLPKKEEEGTSLGLIRGMVSGLKDRGYQSGGFQAYVTSDVLGGAGLSSSAAYEILVGTILSGLYHQMAIDPVVIAQVAQYSENVYFGKPCGLMDQMASSVGGLIHIDFENPQVPMIEKVNVDFAGYGHSLCITDTKGSHADLTDDYAAVPQEMKLVAGYFGKEYLREVDDVEFKKNIGAIRAKVGDRPVLRALHFFAEDKRVGQQVEALREGRFDEFLELVKESGASSFRYLQNVYSSKDVQNQAVSIGLAVSEEILAGNGVCRVHGGGFAGTIQAFVKNEFVESYQQTLDAVFGEGSCHVLKVRPYGGIKVI